MKKTGTGKPSWALAIGLVSLAVFSAIGLAVRAETPPSGPIIYLDQGLTTNERRRFYHLSVGSQLLPLSILRALDNPATGRPFLENPERFGLLPDPDDPDGLPIGLTQELGRGSGVLGPMAGINCAACHVTELRYGGRSVRVDGAAGLMDFEKFSNDLFAALAALESPIKFAEFEFRALRQAAASPPLVPKLPEALSGIATGQSKAPSRGYVQALKADISGWADRIGESKRLFGGKIEFFGRLSRMKPRHPIGPGRTDDWAIARNLLFPEKAWLPRGVAAASFPAIWAYDRFDWLTWNGATRSGMQRGVATTLGLGALYDGSYESTASPAAIVEHDRLAAKMRPPNWPEDVFGAIDQAAGARGAKIYARACAACHDSPRAFGYEEIGTDSTHAESFAIPLGAKSFDGVFATEAQASFAGALSAKIARYTSAAYAAEGWSQAQIEAVAPQEREVWRPVMQIVSRPLDGVWATAPYLANGSVPTIAALLTAPDQRPSGFPIGHFDYDPAALGYRTDIARESAVFWFDTSLPGNSAAGHAYGVDLPPEDRNALIEYLKTK